MAAHVFLLGDRLGRERLGVMQLLELHALLL